MRTSVEDRAELPTSKWNLKFQTPHGGQEWRGMQNFVADFSVTTNPLGTPEKALKAAIEAMSSIHHYPPADFEPAASCVANLLAGSTHDTANVENHEEEADKIKEVLLLGNGASELIDLCVRGAPGRSWRPGPFQVQYKEYERAALADGRDTKHASDKSAKLLCMVNPCNPTGEHWDIERMKNYIESVCDEDTHCLIDESMLPFYGEDWMPQSFVSQRDFVTNIASRKGIYIFVIHSWTKIWSCPGLRIGSLVAPTCDMGNRLRMKQPPWSLNSLAIAFLAEAANDRVYLQQTWDLVWKWREYIFKIIKDAKPHWIIKGVSWMSFLWIETPSEEEASFYVSACHSNGVPIRWGKHGYDLPDHIRIGVRPPEEVKSLETALRLQYVSAGN